MVVSINSNQTFTLDGVNTFIVGGTPISWDNKFIESLQIFSNVPGQHYTVTANLTGSDWNINQFNVDGDQSVGTIVNAVVNDDTSGSNRYIDVLSLYGIGGNVVTLNRTEIGSIHGSKGVDTVTSSTNFVGSIQLFDGNDIVNALAGSISSVDLGEGNDTANIGSGSVDMLNLGNGNNVVTTGAGFVRAILAGDGNDIATIGAGGAGTVNLDGGNDFVTTGAGFVDAIFTGRGDDIVHVGPGGVDAGVGYVNLGRGTNLLTIENLVDVVFAGQNDDTITIGSGGGVGIIHLGGGNDTLNLGSSGSPTVTDNGGFDTVTTTVSRKLGDFPNVEQLTLLGGAAISGQGNALNNVIIGNSAANFMDGGAGNDTLIGNAGKDKLIGGFGNDILIGGAGKDTMTGGFGADVFRFASASESPRGAGADVITDFDDFGNDRIDLSSVFGGTLHYIHTAAFSAAGQVRINNVPGPDVIVEVNTSGASVAEMQIRLTHTTVPSMSAADFFL